MNERRKWKENNKKRGRGRIPEYPLGPTFISLSKGRLEPWESGLAGVQTNKWAVIWGKHARCQR